MSPERWQRVQDVFAAAIECDASRASATARRAMRRRRGAASRGRIAARRARAARAWSIGWRTRSRRRPRWARTQVARLGRTPRRAVPRPGAARRRRDGARLQGARRAAGTPRRAEVPAAAPQRGSRTPKERFLVEARAAAALDHPNICTIHEIGETEDGQLFIAMPLYDGETLQARLKRGRLPFGEAVAHRPADRARARPRARARRRPSRHQAVERHAAAATAR